MKLRFNGVYHTVKHSTGCSSCGSRVTTSNGVARMNTKEYILPSGSARTVRAGQIIEESDEDGSYLASLYYKIGDKIYRDFEVI